MRYGETKKIIVGGAIMKKVLLCATVLGVMLATMPAAAADQAKLPIQLDASAGFDYDSNTNLRSSKDQVKRLQPNGQAGVYKQQANLGYNLALTSGLSLLAQYAYYQDFHFRLGEFDSLSHNLTLTPTLRFWGGSGQIVTLCNFNYLDIGSDKYKTAFSVMPTYFQMVHKRVMLELGFTFERSYYFSPITIPQDDRSAHTYGFSTGMFFFLNDARTAYLQFRYNPLWNEAAGTNFDGVSHKFQIAVMVPFTQEFSVRPYINISPQPYFRTWVNASAPNLNIYPKRNDTYVEGGIQAIYRFYKGFYAEAHYYFTVADSNIAFYSYNRHVLGGTVGYRY
jgi:hypothetical protein